MEEVTLGANLNIEKLNRLSWKVEDNRIPDQPEDPKPKRIDNFIVKLTPMQIRTFILDIIPK